MNRIPLVAEHIVTREMLLQSVQQPIICQHASVMAFAFYWTKQMTNQPIWQQYRLEFKPMASLVHIVHCLMK